MVATLPAQPYITEMIPVGFTDDGSMTFRMTGFFPEVFIRGYPLSNNQRKIVHIICANS